MTYKQAYKLLDSRNIIMDIINVECARGENILIAKKNIIDGINYFLDFVRDNSFKKMKYWYEIPTNSEQRISLRICLELAKIQREAIEMEHENYTYMIASLKGVTK